MHGAYGVGNGALGVFADRKRCLDGRFQIAHVVESVKDSEHINPICGCTFNEFSYHVIRVVAITQNILTAKQHLLRRVGHRRFQLTDPLPRVLA